MNSIITFVFINIFLWNSESLIEDTLLNSNIYVYLRYVLYIIIYNTFIYMYYYVLTLCNIYYVYLYLKLHEVWIFRTINKLWLKIIKIRIVIFNVTNVWVR